MCIFHKFTKWEDKSNGDLRDMDNKESNKGKYIEQERRCEKCNRVELRVEKWYIY